MIQTSHTQETHKQLLKYIKDNINIDEFNTKITIYLYLTDDLTIIHNYSLLRKLELSKIITDDVKITMVINDPRIPEESTMLLISKV